jgi:catechol 2,3-dioxygenase-like lactoylglutathione lyase family enzyme
MLTGIDHIVIVVADLDAAMADYRALGFTVVAGGANPSGTHNALIAFGDGAYLELAAFREPKPAHPWWARLEQGGGLIDVCLQSDDLQADAAAFRAAGIDMSDPVPMSRTRPDGYAVKWVLSIPRASYPCAIPFLIEDVTPRDERVPRERRHDNRAIGLGVATAAVADIEAARRCYGSVLHRTGEAITRDDLQGRGLRFRIGPHGLDSLQPSQSQGPLHEWLAARGPSLFSITLRSDDAARAPLDPARTHRARLQWQ